MPTNECRVDRMDNLNPSFTDTILPPVSIHQFCHLKDKQSQEPTHEYGRFTRRPRLSRQCFEISLVALCSHSLSTANPMTSTAANHLGAFGAGSPNGVSLPAATKTGMSCSAKLSSFAVAATSRRAGKPRAAHAAIAACVRSSVIAHSISPGHTSSSSHRGRGARSARAHAPRIGCRIHRRRAFD